MADLEKSIRLYRIGFLRLILMVSFVMFSSHYDRNSQLPDKIRAKSFELVDNNGNVLAEIDQDYNGNGEFYTKTPNGKQLVKLFTSTEGAGAINTFHPNGNVNFKVTNTSNGGGYLAVFNQSESPVVELGVQTNNGGYVRLRNQYKTEIVNIGSTTSNGGYMSTNNVNGSEVFSIKTIENENGGSLAVMNGYGQRRIALSAGEKGGRIGVYNNSEIRVGYLGCEDNQSGYMSVYNSSGTKTGNLPPY